MLDDVESEISDDELTALALAADPDVPLAEDAVPFRPLHDMGAALLPEWYMPAPARAARSDWRAGVAIAMSAGLVLINAFGVCVTYGIPQIF